MLTNLKVLMIWKNSYELEKFLENYSLPKLKGEERQMTPYLLKKLDLSLKIFPQWKL